VNFVDDDDPVGVEFLDSFVGEGPDGLAEHPEGIEVVVGRDEFVPLPVALFRVRVVRAVLGRNFFEFVLKVREEERAAQEDERRRKDP
jgi:hypothetical protein